MSLSESTFRELALRRRNLISLLSKEKGRLAHASSPELEASHRLLIDTLTSHIEQVHGKLEQAMQEIPALRLNSELLQTVPGVDAECSQRLLIELPELGITGNKQLSRIVGVAPMQRTNHPDGEWNPTREGNPYIRHLLHTATETASQSDTRIGDFFNRLRSKGKPENVVIVATMRKMLSIMNSIIHRQEPYQGFQEE